MNHVSFSLFTACLTAAAMTVSAQQVQPQNPPVQTNATPQAKGEMSNAEIAKKLSNPVAHIINVPFQYNWDYGGGPKDDGQHHYLQVQPVIPFSLSEDWAVISRTVMYFENKHNFGYNGVSGLGDFTQTFFVSPVAKEKGTPIWGLGPVFLLPTATDDYLGSGKWGAGPSAVFVKELEHWTLGLLASHTWSFAGESDREYVSRSFLQPFVARHFPAAVTVTATSEYTYDWHDNEEIFPVNLMVAKVVRVGKMPINFSLGGRYYFDKPSGGPDWGARFMVTFVLPGF